MQHTVEFQYLAMDHQGSVAKVTDANQNIQISYVNDAFGRQIVAPTGANTAVPNDLVFQSNWITASIGTKRYGISPSRVYDPELGRFLQRDPFPAALKVVQKARGNALGIFAKTIFEHLFWRYLLADLGGKNLYTYASGNPVNRLDWAGMPDEDSSWLSSAATWLNDSGALDATENTLSFLSGAGDAITFGGTTALAGAATDAIGKAGGWNDYNSNDLKRAKKCSKAFTAGQVAGTVAAAAVGAAQAAARLAAKAAAQAGKAAIQNLAKTNAGALSVLPSSTRAGSPLSAIFGTSPGALYAYQQLLSTVAKDAAGSQALRAAFLAAVIPAQEALVSLAMASGIYTQTSNVIDAATGGDDCPCP